MQVAVYEFANPLQLIRRVSLLQPIETMSTTSSKSPASESQHTQESWWILVACPPTIQVDPAEALSLQDTVQQFLNSSGTLLNQNSHYKNSW